jgi:hypothetical protein
MLDGCAKRLTSRITPFGFLACYHSALLQLLSAMLGGDVEPLLISIVHTASEFITAFSFASCKFCGRLLAGN